MIDELDLDSRRLCPDGACVGVLDDAGRCPVCGSQGEAAPQALPAHQTNGVSHAVPEADMPRHEASDSDADEASDDDRQLCPDGNCIGIIGKDGRCKVCGTVAT